MVQPALCRLSPCPLGSFFLEIIFEKTFLMKKIFFDGNFFLMKKKFFDENFFLVKIFFL